MWCHLNKPFFMQQFVGIFSLLTSQTAALDCETMKKTNEFPSPKVYSETDVIMKGQNVSLFCSNQNKSLQITYVMFRGMKHLGTWDGKGEPMIFNLRISEAGDLGPYKCKTQVSNCSRYSQEFSFTFANPVTTPVLNISAFQTETARYITLRCISYNGSLPINYTFFEKDVAISPAISKNVREPAEFNLTERITGEREEYRCKAKNRLPNHAKYSQPFTMPSTGGDSCPFCLQLLLPGLLLLLIVIILMLAFWILPKYKARKAMRDNAPRNYGNKPMEVGIYANVCQNQAGTGHSKEIHYATPVFQEVAQGDHEAHNDCKTGYVYSELVL
ncbi:allergin-1 isoform X2 [Equus przewalskii]|uniref:Allergin-1 isoform X2 n=1 Tax=Equus przewalskii TaxID=9798 RepID=A0ABM2EM38_EQUPR|nr:PREDICTED: allergin-1 isoform X3 [Equus przewalskii]XP_014594776.1 allergin-1 isoform X2 [Equus caballus]